jgi:hypothetical protein
MRQEFFRTFQIRPLRRVRAADPSHPVVNT